jgi:hypothetical protein
LGEYTKAQSLHSIDLPHPSVIMLPLAGHMFPCSSMGTVAGIL